MSRMKGVERYCDLLQFARGKLRPVEAKPVSEMTWEEFVVLYWERNLKGVPESEIIYD